MVITFPIHVKRDVYQHKEALLLRRKYITFIGYNKISWTGWHKQQQFILSHFCMIKGQGQGCCLLLVDGHPHNRGANGWMASLTQWTWVWTKSGRWWRTGKPGMLQSVGSQTVWHDWVTEKQQPSCIFHTLVFPLCTSIPGISLCVQISVFSLNKDT